MIHKGVVDDWKTTPLICLNFYRTHYDQFSGYEAICIPIPSVSAQEAITNNKADIAKAIIQMQIL